MEPRDPQPGAPEPRPKRGRATPRRATAVAVLGSVAALGGAGSAAAQTTHRAPDDRQQRPARRADPLPVGELALLGLVFSALSAAAPAIARPVLGRGVADGTITQAEADGFLARLRAAEEGGQAGPATAPPATPAARELFQQALATVRAELPLIAGPRVDAARADGSITDAQAERLRARFGRGPGLGFGLVLRNARAAGATRLP